MPRKRPSLQSHSAIIYYLIRKHIHCIPVPQDTERLVDNLVDNFLDGFITVQMAHVVSRKWA